MGNLGNNVDLLKLDDSRLDNLFNYGIKRFLECGVDSFYVDYNNINDKVFLSKLVNYIYLYSSNISLKRSFIIGRNHGFAVHKNMVVFVGNTHVDWNTLEVLPRYFSQASNSGISFVGAPIGGFYGGVEDFELYIRYIQLGVFSSLMVLASDYCKYYRREPWRWGTSEKEMIKKYLKQQYLIIQLFVRECKNVLFLLMELQLKLLMKLKIEVKNIVMKMVFQRFVNI